MNLVRTRDKHKRVLVQVDIEAAFVQSDGGESTVKFDPQTIRGGEHPWLLNPMSTGFAAADLTRGRIQLLCDAERPAESGTTFLD